MVGTASTHSGRLHRHLIPNAYYLDALLLGCNRFAQRQHINQCQHRGIEFSCQPRRYVQNWSVGTTQEIAVQLLSNDWMSGLAVSPFEILPSLANWTEDIAAGCWRRLVRLQHFTTARSHFASSIHTICVAVSISIHAHKSASTSPWNRSVSSTTTCLQNSINLKGEDRSVWGLGSDHRKLFVATALITGERMIRSCSAKPFKEDTKYNKRTQKIEKSTIRSDADEKDLPSGRAGGSRPLSDWMNGRVTRLLDVESVPQAATSSLHLYKEEAPRFVQKLSPSRSSGAMIGGKTCTRQAAKKELLHLYCRVETVNQFCSRKLHTVCHHQLANQVAKWRFRDVPSR
ncbi:hypothetical protein PybrP1_000363, partial [[Pythium] brassicae (nom. inval.)]